jgi:iron complex outermembrane recepter protein
MIRFFTRLACAMSLVLVTAIHAMAQTAVSGTVVDKATQESLPGVSVSVKGKTEGGSTNASGQFSFTTSQTTPFTIVVSYIGYGTVEREITGTATGLKIELAQQAVLGQEVVVAASRTPERILESPVSIERVGTAAIQQQAAATFYDGLVNLKGVEVSAQSLTFKSVNTRGFNANGNVRFNQFVDGMDNQAPGLNFAVGNIVGVSELDVENVELLPGASSALYGAGGTNGTLLITSKSPFTYQGFSALLKTGANHADNRQRDASPYQDMSLRYAKAFNNKFAFKVNFSYLTANDWQAQDYSNFNRVTQAIKPGTRETDPNFDGVNIYGDEINTTFGATAGLLNGQTVSRTGYAENVLVNYDTKSIKGSGAIHYKLTDNIEAIAQGNWGAGTSVYTGSDRYSLKDFTLGQYKLELRSADFFLRGYTTQERSGDAYNATALGTLINEYWKPSTTWFTQYAQMYNGARLGMIPGVPALSNADAHIFARTAADAGRPQPGSPEFDALKNDITSRTIGPAGGARFNDKSNLYSVEGMYNLTNLVNKQSDVLVGERYRTNDLNS